MIVISRKYGQLANRLILFAHFLACAREQGVRLWNPSFCEYAQFFLGTRNNLWSAYPQVSADRTPPQWLRRLCYQAIYLPVRLLAALRLIHWPLRIVRIASTESCNLSDTSFLKLLRQPQPVVVQGWQFRDPTAFFKHANAIREYFRPIEVHAAAVSRLMRHARKNADLVIGIHIRHGDYAQFCGGQYFYPSATYRAVMEQAARLFHPGRVAFLVCSNAPQTPEDFVGLQVISGTGHLVEDLYAFAQCDYLIGPPSTYTMWASFYGKVPLCVLKPGNKPLEEASFRADCFQGVSETHKGAAGQVASHRSAAA